MIRKKIEAAEASARLINQNRTLIFSGKGYLARIQQIDTAGCPAAFRENWLAYVQSWDRHISYDLLSAARDAVEVETSVHDGIAAAGPVLRLV